MKAFYSIFVIAVALIPQTTIAQPALVPLGDFPGGPFLSVGRALSGNGQVAVGHSSGTLGLGTSGAFRWTADTGLVPLGRPKNGSSSATGVSTDGRYIVGDFSTAEGISGFVWTPDGDTSMIPDIPGGLNVSRAADASNSGVVVGASIYTDGPFGPLHQALRWTQDGGMVPMGFLNGGTESFAFGVSADGSVIAGHGDTGNWIWTEGAGMQAVGWEGFSVQDLTADGKFLVGVTPETRDGVFRGVGAAWSKETGRITLSMPDDFFEGTSVSLVARDASLNAEVIFGMNFDLAESKPYVWFDQGATGMNFEDYLLDLGLDVRAMGYHMTEVNGVSDDGTRFLVKTFNPDNNSEAVLIIVPAPATASIAAIAFVAPRRRRTR